MERSEGWSDNQFWGVRGRDDGFIHVLVIKRGSLVFFICTSYPSE